MKKLLITLAVALGWLGIMASTSLPGHAATTPGFTTSGSTILDNGVSWTPYGFTLSEFQDEAETFPSCECEYTTIDAQLAAIAGAWHGNTVRLQVEQDEWVAGGSAQASYRAKVEAVVADAESKGLVVVLNDQTEGQQGFGIVNEPLPTGATVQFYEQLPAAWRTDPDIILDQFNEPRYLQGTPSNPALGWNDWYQGTGGPAITWKNLNGGTQSAVPVGTEQLVSDIRADGFTNQIWIETPGYEDLLPLVNNLNYEIHDPLNDVVYEYHHVSTGQNADPSVAQWNAQFGNLVTDDHLAVVDGEWSMRSESSAYYSSTYEPSGDAGVCWGDAPSMVPQYLTYLKSLGIGMTVWTLGTEPAIGAPNGPPVNTPTGGPTSYNSYTAAQTASGTAPCITSSVGEYGAGQDIMNWFNTNDANPAGS